MMDIKKYATLWREATPLEFGFIGKSRGILRGVLIDLISSVSGSSKDNFLRCLYCHNVFDDQRHDFEELVLRLKDTGHFVDTDTCIEMLQGRKQIDGRYYHLSFDDGFRNNYTNALPILRKHGVPAIFFVPSSLVGANWDKTKQYCIETTRYTSVIEMLRWSDLKEMVLSGYEIGSHTKNHVQLSAISDDVVLLEDEILGSKLELESKLAVECKYISWPFGTLTDVDDKALTMVKSAGYSACFGAYRGSIVAGQTDMFSIPRHHFEVHWPISHVEYFAKGNMEMTG
jgi:peptidoglycan/xylan/chitin deacetylase (PgdA/CDA1 family)